MTYKEFLSLFAIILIFIAYFPYIRSILYGTVRPHVFSWIVWSITTSTVFLAQLKSGGGVGAWPVGASGVITLFIAFLAYLKRADISVVRVDWIFFVAALFSLPLWYLTSDPLWAVVLLTMVDVFGFFPTLRKAYETPYSESVIFFSLFTVSNLIAILALESYTVTTVLFPAVIAIASLLLVAVVVYKRYIHKSKDGVVSTDGLCDWDH